jgi:hypothetical protein
VSTSPRIQRAFAPASFALWCRSAAQNVCLDPCSVMHLIVGDELVEGLGRSVGGGRVRVGVGGGWRWPSHERDQVGEFVLREPGGWRGLQLIGWWTPVDPQQTDSPGSRSVLEMEVAGVTLWEGSRHVSTEDTARIAALLR